MPGNTIFEECAAAILQVFADQKVRENGKLMAGPLKLKVLENRKYKVEDYPDGMSYAIERGWLSLEGTEIRLTPAGFQQLPKR
jgi:hypothetical protein